MAASALAPFVGGRDIKHTTAEEALLTSHYVEFTSYLGR